MNLEIRRLARSMDLAARHRLGTPRCVTAASHVVREEGHGLLWPPSAVFDPGRAYRYLLTRGWPDDAPLVWIMLNPSTADAFADDPAIRRCCGFARGLGAGGIVVVNLFAWRAAKPAGLRRAADPVGPLNDQYLAAETARPGRRVVAAWGAHGGLGGRAAVVVAMLTAAGVPLHCLGLTGRGQPVHPLYLPAGTGLIRYPPGA